MVNLRDRQHCGVVSGWCQPRLPRSHNQNMTYLLPLASQKKAVIVGLPDCSKSALML